jgi:hypothetical protein
MGLLFLGLILVLGRGSRLLIISLLVLEVDKELLLGLFLNGIISVIIACWVLTLVGIVLSRELGLRGGGGCGAWVKDLGKLDIEDVDWDRLRSRDDHC